MTLEKAGTVLVVEDESETAFILAANLRAAGYEVLEARDGCECLRLAGDRLPDVIIMDLGLPRMDGVSATRALKADPKTEHIPVIMLTARSAKADVVRGLEVGALDYLSKPFDMMELLARVGTVHRLVQARKGLDQLNNRLVAEVDVKTRRLQVLYNFVRGLNRADSRGEVLDLILQCVRQVTGARRISLLLRDASGDRLRCERAIGIDPQVAEQICVGTREGIAGQVFHSGKTLAARAFDGAAGREGTYLREAFLSTPLVSTSLQTHDGVIGVLNATEKDDESAFSEEEIECIRSIADAGATALDNVGRRERLEQSVRVLLQTLGELAEYRDEETTEHLVRVSTFCRILARELARHGAYVRDVTEEFIELLVQAAPMHDLGKVGIPDDILTKPSKLTNEEYQIMKTHTDIGRRVLSRAVDPANPVPLLQMCIDIAYGHHERFDGKGYPRRIAGHDIPLAARIIALVDAYDAITSERRYKRARSHGEAVEIIRDEAGKHFDPYIVEAFLRCENAFERVLGRREATPEPAVV